MGRANRKAVGNAARRGSDNPVRETEAANDYLGLDDYASRGIASEALETYVYGSEFSEKDIRLALDTVRRVESLALDRETRDTIHRAPLAPEGLRVAESVFLELGDSVVGERMISESFDPDGDFLSQDDSDHMYALAAYLRAIREGQVVRGRGEGLGDARLDYYADIVDRARAV